MIAIPLTELDEINYIKAILIKRANEYDKQNGEFKGIQSIQKMAGFANLNEYVSALHDGLCYGNWPWIR